MQTNTDVQALLQSDKASHYGTHGKLVMQEQTIRKAYKMSDKLSRIQVIIEAAEETIQRYESKEDKTLAMVTAYEHIKGVMNETDSVLTDTHGNPRTYHI